MDRDLFELLRFLSKTRTILQPEGSDPQSAIAVNSSNATQSIVPVQSNEVRLIEEIRHLLESDKEIDAQRKKDTMTDLQALEGQLSKSERNPAILKGTLEALKITPAIKAVVDILMLSHVGCASRTFTDNDNPTSRVLAAISRLV